jgi:hypothetical protein
MPREKPLSKEEIIKTRMREHSPYWLSQHSKEVVEKARGLVDELSKALPGKFISLKITGGVAAGWAKPGDDVDYRVFVRGINDNDYSAIEKIVNAWFDRHGLKQDEQVGMIVVDTKLGEEALAKPDKYPEVYHEGAEAFHSLFTGLHIANGDALDRARARAVASISRMRDPQAYWRFVKEHSDHPLAALGGDPGFDLLRRQVLLRRMQMDELVFPRDADLFRDPAIAKYSRKSGLTPRQVEQLWEKIRRRFPSFSEAKKRWPAPKA